MKRPEHRRKQVKPRRISPPPEGIDLDAVAGQVRYTGSPYHKDTPSFAGPVGRPRPRSSPCPRHLAARQADIQAWLAEAVRRGHCGSHWRGNFPHHVWHREGEVVFEGCQTNQGNGEYHGYPLEPGDDFVEGLP